MYNTRYLWTDFPSIHQSEDITVIHRILVSSPQSDPVASRHWLGTGHKNNILSMDDNCPQPRFRARDLHALLLWLGRPSYNKECLTILIQNKIAVLIICLT